MDAMIAASRSLSAWFDKVVSGQVSRYPRMIDLTFSSEAPEEDRTVSKTFPFISLSCPIWRGVAPAVFDIHCA